MTYCTRDARRLVPPEEMIGGPLRGATGDGGLGSLSLSGKRRGPGVHGVPSRVRARLAELPA